MEIPLLFRIKCLVNKNPATGPVLMVGYVVVAADGPLPPWALDALRTIEQSQIRYLNGSWWCEHPEWPLAWTNGRQCLSWIADDR